MNASESGAQTPATIQSRPNLRTDIILMCVVFAVALLYHLWFLNPSPFDGLYGQDSYAYYDFAGELRTALAEHRAPGAFFWPLGYPTLLAAAFAVFGTQATVGQALNVILGTALSLLVYILARQIGLRPFGGIVSAILMTLCGQAIQSGLVLMSDIPSLFWGTLSVVLLLHYLHSADTHPGTRWLILSAAMFAMASITRWIYLVLAVPFTIAVLHKWRGKVRWRETVLAMLGAAVIFIPQAIYSSTNPWPTLNHEWVEGWSPANAFKREFTNADGHFTYDKINAIYYAQPYYDPYYLAPVFTPFLLIGLWRLFRWGLPQGMLFAAWAILPYLFLAGIPYQNIRFPLIVVPVVAIIAGAGLETAAYWIGKFKLPHAIYVGYVAAAILIVYGVSQSHQINRVNVSNFIANQQRDKDTAAWTAKHVPDGATLYTFGLTLTLQHYTTLKVFELFYETPDTLAEKWTIGKDDYLLINVQNIETQWTGRAPQADFHWLRDKRGLTELGRYGYFTLYRVKG
jgi:hypothetical protein